jgi:hypothetical protein
LALYGVNLNHTTESCPVNNKEVATRVVQISKMDLSPLLTKYKINKVVAQYHSPLEHTLVWVFEAEDPHLIQGFCIESGLASFNKLTIVPLMTFGEGVIPTLKKIHNL